MADYSFAPSGGPRGYLGAYNFGIDTEKTLAEMGQKKQSHDLQMDRDRLKYTIERANEDMLGQISRESQVQDLKDKDELRPWMKESARAKAGQEVSNADIKNRLIEADTIQKKMDAMESAEAYLRSRGGENGEMMPAPSDLDGSYGQVREILRNGGWDDASIDKYNSKGPQALTSWIQEGARAAKVDAPRLAERRKQLHALNLAALQHPPTNEKKYSPTTELGALASKPSWSPEDQQTARGLLELVAKDMKETTFMALMSMQNLKYEPEEAMKKAGEITRMNLENTFPDIIRRMGGLPAATTPTKGDPDKPKDDGTVKRDTKAPEGSKSNPLPRPAKPSDMEKGKWYVDKDKNLYEGK